MKNIEIKNMDEINNWITIENVHNSSVNIRVPLGRSWGHNIDPNSLSISRGISCDGLVVAIRIEIDVDGNVFWLSTLNSENENPYWYYFNDFDENLELTEAQVETLAKIHLRVEVPFGLGSCLRGPMCSKVFHGYHMQSLSEKFGDGSKQILNG